MQNNDIQKQCVYKKPEGLCTSVSALSVEDFLPRGFGKFRYYQRLNDRICRDCNRKLGKLDEFLLHLGHPAILRVLHGIEGRRQHRTKDLFHERTYGVAPVESVARLPGEDSLTRLELVPGGAIPRREISFLTRAGEERVVPIPHEIDSVERLHDHFNRYGVAAEWTPVSIVCPHDEGGQALIRLVKDALRFEVVSPEDSADSLNTGDVTASTLIAFAPEHYRAIAKIAFHFFLWCYRSTYTGFEQQFDSIKRFIYEGGNHREHMVSSLGAFDRPEGIDVPWAHVLAAGWLGPQAMATVQLFAGTNSGTKFKIAVEDGRIFDGEMGEHSLIWFVRLAETKSQKQSNRALAFLGYGEQRDGFDGEVRELVLNPAATTDASAPAFLFKP
jgi:hypothetical protein